MVDKLFNECLYSVYKTQSLRNSNKELKKINNLLKKWAWELNRKFLKVKKKA